MNALLGQGKLLWAWGFWTTFGCKWALMSLLAVPLCFALSSLIRKLPYAERVL